MAICELELRLDAEEASYPPGSRIAGAVQVRVDEECPCQQLSVALVQRVTKRGQLVRELSEPPVAMFQGSWSPGEHSHRFELPAPAGPPSFVGAHLTVRWELVARAQVGDNADPRGSIDITVTPPAQPALVEPAQTGGPADVAVDPHAEPQPVEVGRGIYVVLVIAIVVALGGLPLYLAYDVVELLAAGGAISGVITALLVLRWLLTHGPLKPKPRRYARHVQLVGWPQLRVAAAGRDAYRGGEQDEAAVTCTVWVKPDCPPLDVTATLAVVEEVTVVTGTHRRGNFYETHVESVDQQQATLVAGPEPGTYVGRLPLPTGVPTSFECDDATIQWRVTAVCKAQDDDGSMSCEVPLQVR